MLVLLLGWAKLGPVAEPLAPPPLVGRPLTGDAEGRWSGRAEPAQVRNMKMLGILVAAISAAWSGFAAVQSPVADPAVSSVFVCATTPTPPTAVDWRINLKLSKAGIRPAFCTDAVFVRRAYLDAIGTLPTAEEARAFIADPSPGKRVALIDRLLARPEYPDYWAMKGCDLLRVKAEFPVNLWPNAAQAYHRWIRTCFQDNKPYDQFVREMLTANGSNFRVGPVNFYRAMQNRTPDGIASTVALTFMGTRAENWPTNRLAGMAAFFSQVAYKPTREWKEEVVFWDPDQGLPPVSAPAGEKRRSLPGVARFPDGSQAAWTPDRDPREIFADWLINPQNPWFTRAIANRAWSWLMGRGIIHEPDDIRPDNPPSNPELLACLEKELIASGYDLKALFRLILTSRAYQFSSVASKATVTAVEGDFACYPIRQLDAEVLADAINRVTHSTDLYTSAIPEPFTFIPENLPAIALPDGSISSPFLELFGRPARATGMENERVNRPAPAQRMYLLNSSAIQRKIEESAPLRDLTAPKRSPSWVVEDLYLTILSRFPTAAETRTALDHARGKGVKGREAWIDLAWALINSDEFCFRH